MPVILLSARAGEEARVEGLDAGADDYLTKPFSARELLARVGANLSMARVRREALEAVQQNAERLRQLFEQAPGFMCTLRGPDHVFEMANAAYIRLIGERDIIGRTVRDALPEVEGQGYLELLDDVYRTGNAFTDQGTKLRVRRSPHGPIEERFVDFVFQPIRDAKGAVTGIFVQGSDVTDARLAEIALRASELQFRTLCPGDAEPCLDFAAGWFARLVQRSGLRIQRRGAGRAGRRGVGRHRSSGRRAGSGGALGRALSSVTPMRPNSGSRRADGAYRWHIARALPIRGADGGNHALDRHQHRHPGSEDRH